SGLRCRRSGRAGRTAAGRRRPAVPGGRAIPRASESVASSSASCHLPWSGYSVARTGPGRKRRHAASLRPTAFRSRRISSSASASNTAQGSHAIVAVSAGRPARWARRSHRRAARMRSAMSYGSGRVTVLLQVQVLEQRELLAEVQLHLAGRAVALLADDQLGATAQVLALVRLAEVVLRAVEE